MAPKLSVEFSRFIMLKKLIKTMYKYCETEQERFFSIFAMEEWLLSLANDIKPDDEDPYFARRKLTLDYRANADFINDREQRHVDLRTKFMKDSLVIIEEWLSRDVSLDEEPRVKVLDNFMRIYTKSHSYIYAFNPDYFELYQTKISAHDLAIVIMRYACCIDRHKQWSLSVEIFSTLVHVYGVSIEGFAAPHNAQIYKYKDNGNYCSIFDDTDKLMFSSGSFFKQNFVGECVFAFPPYVTNILNMLQDFLKKTFERAELQDKPTRIFLMIPRHKKCPELIEFLDEFKYKRRRFYVDRGELYTIDTQSDSYAVASFSNYIYVLEYGYDPSYEYNVIEKALERAKENCRKINQTREYARGYTITASYLDMGNFINGSSYRFVKQFLDELIITKKLPPYISSIFEPVVKAMRPLIYIRNQLLSHLLMRAVFKFNKRGDVKFSWAEIAEELTNFITELLKNEDN